MENSISTFGVLAIFSGILALVGVVVGFIMRPMKQSWHKVAIAALPGVLMLILFYSLAFHMRQNLGTTPFSIGESGFSKILAAHANIATNYFAALVVATTFVWPVAFGLCLLIRRWRRGTYYLGVYALSFVINLGAMTFAPTRFLNWWWD